MNATDRLNKENEDLRSIIQALIVCSDEGADAHTQCPMYDENRKDRCKLDITMKRYGLDTKE